MNQKLNDLQIVREQRIIVSCFIKDGLYNVFYLKDDCIMKFTNPKEALKFIGECLERDCSE